MIRCVLIYTGHIHNPENAPYHYQIEKRIGMFKTLRNYRAQPWTVETLSGENLIEKMRSLNPRETLFVMPAGESSKYDRSFSDEQLSFLENFFKRGGKGYFTCGAAYWASRKRIYNGLCELNPETQRTVEKLSRLPLFQGTAIGPLCPYPATKFKAGFYSDAVAVTNGTSLCNIYLGGGGAFIPDKDSSARVLVRYPHDELRRVGKDDVAKWENAAIFQPVGEGAIVCASFHPYYGANDIDVEAYEEAFAGSGTNWREIHRKLSPQEERMRFVYDTLILPLESSDLSPLGPKL